jgi:hypothetical protein
MRSLESPLKRQALAAVQSLTNANDKDLFLFVCGATLLPDKVDLPDYHPEFRAAEATRAKTAETQRAAE